MAKTLEIKVRSSINWDLLETNTGLTNASANRNNFTYSKTLTNGTAANQADLLYAASGTIGTSATLSLDLAGTLDDFFGDTITMARVKVIYITITTDTSASSVNVGGNANAFDTFLGDASDEIIIRNGGNLTLTAPDATAYAVTASTGDILDITNNDGSNTATYQIAIVGASA